MAAVNVAASAGSLAIIGSTLHVKMKTANVGSTTRPMLALRLSVPTNAISVTIDAIGSQFLYESPVSLSQGQIGGIGYPQGSNKAGTVNVRLAGGSAIDGGGTGGTLRADIVGSPSDLIGTHYEPTIQAVGTKLSSAVSGSALPLLASSGRLMSTVNVQNGAAVFPGANTVAVTLPLRMPDANYRVGLSANANETVYVNAKTTTGFTLKSSNAGSTASVDWTATR